MWHEFAHVSRALNERSSLPRNSTVSSFAWSIAIGQGYMLRQVDENHVYDDVQQYVRIFSRGHRTEVDFLSNCRARVGEFVNSISCPFVWGQLAIRVTALLSCSYCIKSAVARFGLIPLITMGIMHYRPRPPLREVHCLNRDSRETQHKIHAKKKKEKQSCNSITQKSLETLLLVFIHRLH